MSDEKRGTERFNFLSLVALVQGGLFLLALIAGSFMQSPPWKRCSFTLAALGIGVVATIPMLAFFLVTYRSNAKGLVRIRRFIQEALGKPLAACNYLELCGVATMAGLSEEFFFRGVLEPGLGAYNPLIGFIGCNLIFGACHAATRLYGVLAALLGCYLSLTLRITTEPNLVVPIISHSLYEMIAFIAVRNSYLKSYSQNHGEPISDESDAETPIVEIDD